MSRRQSLGLGQAAIFRWPEDRSVKASKFTDQQLAMALFLVGTPIEEACRNLSVTEATFYGRRMHLADSTGTVREPSPQHPGGGVSSQQVGSLTWPQTPLALY